MAFRSGAAGDSSEECERPFDPSEHAAWKERVMNERMVVSVTSPEQHSRWGKAYINFLVRTEPQQYRVRRRYSDFEWLRQSVKARFVGLVPPPLPGKRGIWGATSHVSRRNSQDPCEDSFVLERMRMLSLFADSLVRNPYLRADDVCRRFLSENDEKGWDQFKKSHKPGSVAPTEAEQRWRLLVNNTHMTEAAERMIADLSRQFDVLEKPLKEMHTACTRYAVQLHETTNAAAEVRAALSAVGDSEATCADRSKVECAHQEWDGMRPLFHEADDRLATVVASRRHEPVMVEALLMDTAKFRMLELHSLRETVKSRAAAMQALQKARAQLDKHEREKAAVVGKNGRPEKMERLDAQIHEDKGTVNRCLYRATSMTKGLVQCEIDRLWKEKMSDYKRMMGAYAAAQVAYASKVRDTWRGFMETTGLSVDDMVAQAKHMMGPLQDARTASSGSAEEEGGGV